jgi:uncharacterized membrane protein YfcA
MNLSLYILVMVVAFFLEFIDSSFGQCYGTIGSPIYILMGFPPLLVVPSILISQCVCDFMAAFYHNKFKNVDFSSYNTSDSKRSIFIIGCGIIGVIAGALIAVNISKDIMTLYIGLLVTIIGLLVVSGKQFRFTWNRLAFLAAIIIREYLVADMVLWLQAAKPLSGSKVKMLWV